MSVHMEELNNVLWFTGNIHPDEEPHVVNVLHRYLSAGYGNPRVLDMSGVGYIPSVVARALLAEVERAPIVVTVRGSVPVVRTFSAVGVPEGVGVETCREPNRKTMSAAAGVTGEVGAKRTGSAIVPAVQTVTREETLTRIMPRVPPVPSSRAVRPAENQTLVLPEGPPAGTPLVGEKDELPDELSVLRKLIVMKVYNFRIPGLAGELTGRVVARIGGPWIIVETHGAWKFLDMGKVSTVEVLS